MTLLLRAVLLTLAIAPITGCDAPDSTPADAASASGVDPAVTISEQRTEQLSEVARAMRDADPNLAWPVVEAFWAEVRRRHPAADPASDLMLDGWQRPLLYARDGDMRSYRLYSAGPNGRDEYGTGDDVALHQGETIIK